MKIQHKDQTWASSLTASLLLTTVTIVSPSGPSKGEGPKKLNKGEDPCTGHQDVTNQLRDLLLNLCRSQELAKSSSFSVKSPKL